MILILTLNTPTIYRVNKYWNNETTEGKGERERQGEEREEEGIYGEQGEGIYNW